jgi:hypothetical protein
MARHPAYAQAYWERIAASPPEPNNRLDPRNYKNGIFTGQETDNYLNVTQGSLAQGFTSLAKYLGVAPHDAVFANSLVVNPQGPSQRLAASDDLEGVSHQYVLAMSGSGSTALHLPLGPAQTAYVQQYIAHGKLHEVAPDAGSVASSRIYPAASVFAQLADKPLLALRGKTLINSYVTEEVEAAADLAQGKTLMSNRNFLQFVGKEYLHENSAGLSVPPGVVIYHPTQLNAKLGELHKIIESFGKDPATTKIWVKPTSLSGGQGVMRAPGANKEQIKPALANIDHAYRECGFGPANPAQLFAGLDYFMPIVLEMDVGALPDFKKIAAETGVQAALGPKGITIIETVVNRTKDGEYIGGSLPTAQDEPVVAAANKAAIPLLQKLWKDGYRGYVGVDAIVAEKLDGTYKAVLNEANTRLTGNTPLVALAHRFSELSGKKLLALSASYKLPLPHDPTADAFASVMQAIGPQLFKADETGFTGIVPAVVDAPPGRDYITCKAVMLADTPAQLKQQQAHMQKLALTA